jgi:arylformamidase
MRIYDISLPLGPGIAGWPGDAPYQWHWSQRKSSGASVNVGCVSLSVHTGTHTDAPYHFTDDGKTVEALDLAAYVGPARVLDVRNRPLIRVEDLAWADFAHRPRLLLRTDAWTAYDRFPGEIPVLDSDVPAWLAARGVVLVGVDVPSVDALDSKDLPIHHALGRHGIAILENLRLTDVPPGAYELIALPLKLAGADGAPVRAVLRQPITATLS